MPQHATKGSIKPGEVRNPTGKNGNVVIPVEVLNAARARSIAAIETLDKWMRYPTASVNACIALLDRAWGKPAQSMHLGGALDLSVDVPGKPLGGMEA